MAKKNWIQKANAEMKRKGTKGAFTKQAKAHGKGVQAYATEVIKKYKGKKGLTKIERRNLRRAVFAKNMGKIH
jgi:hypothetical protein